MSKIEHLKKHPENFKILVDITDKIDFNSGGEHNFGTFEDLHDPEILKRIYRIQFASPTLLKNLHKIVRLIRDFPSITLRFYGDYSSDLIDWSSLHGIEALDIDMWGEVKHYRGLSQLTGLRSLNVSKYLKNSASLKEISELKNLEVLFTSISKDIESISSLSNLKLFSISEIGKLDIDFIRPLKQLRDLRIWLGSHKNFLAINDMPNLEKLFFFRIRNFDDSVVQKIENKSVQFLRLMDTPEIHSLSFVKNFESLKYLRLDGVRNLKSYSALSELSTLKEVSITKSRPEDKDLSFLSAIKKVSTGDSYTKQQVHSFIEKFRGQNLWIRGKSIVGDFEYDDPWDPRK